MPLTWNCSRAWSERQVFEDKFYCIAWQWTRSLLASSIEASTSICLCRTLLALLKSVRILSSCQHKSPVCVYHMSIHPSGWIPSLGALGPRLHHTYWTTLFTCIWKWVQISCWRKCLRLHSDVDLRVNCSITGEYTHISHVEYLRANEWGIYSPHIFYEFEEISCRLHQATLWSPSSVRTD